MCRIKLELTVTRIPKGQRQPVEVDLGKASTLYKHLRHTNMQLECPYIKFDDFFVDSF